MHIQLLVFRAVMGRRKQSRPHRSGGVILDSNDNGGEAELDKQKAFQTEEAQKEPDEVDIPYYVEVDRSGWVSDDHLDISEVVLMNLNLTERFAGHEVNEEFLVDNKYSLRFRLSNMSEYLDRMKLGHWPVISSTDISLEFVEKCTVDDTSTSLVILSGTFDGSDEGISGLVHLASLKFLTVRPVLGIVVSEDISSLRVRVEMLKSAFDASESLFDNTRQLWKKSMMNVMAWLRPEVMTSEARYGVSKSTDMELDSHTEMADTNSNPKKDGRFDAAVFYEAIKPSK